MKPCIAIALLLPAAAAFAQSGAASAGASATGSASATAHAASFRCGGVGEDEQQRIKSEASQHDVLLTFATTRGAYVADVDVQVVGNGRTVLQAHCGGPLMLMDLSPKGRYEVRATAGGRTQKKTVTVGGARPQAITFAWPD